MSQSFTFIDVAGNRADYTVSDKDHRDDFRWSTDHGDHGVAPSELFPRPRRYPYRAPGPDAARVVKHPPPEPSHV
jgi:hypothetical protein